MYVSGINCPKQRAYQCMMATKRRYGKLGGYVAYHGYRSFVSGEVTLAEAHQIGLETARRIETVPTIVKDLDRNEAVIFLVDSNLQRENILPSEKAFAYKMKLEALKHQGKTSVQVEQKLSRTIVAESCGVCNKRYIGVYLYKGQETPGGMPRILDDDLFYRVQALMNKNKSAPARTHGEGEYLFRCHINYFCRFAYRKKFFHFCNFPLDFCVTQRFIIVIAPPTNHVKVRFRRIL